MPRHASDVFIALMQRSARFRERMRPVRHAALTPPPPLQQETPALRHVPRPAPPVLRLLFAAFIIRLSAQQAYYMPTIAAVTCHGFTYGAPALPERSDRRPQQRK